MIYGSPTPLDPIDQADIIDGCPLTFVSRVELADLARSGDRDCAGACGRLDTNVRLGEPEEFGRNDRPRSRCPSTREPGPPKTRRYSRAGSIWKGFRVVLLARE